jgi:glycosyltransferase involved in cell wall biosynthesis
MVPAIMSAILDHRKADWERTVLWWGRFDPNYSRNRVVRRLLVELGLKVKDFHPAFSRLGDLEANLRRLPRPALVWVPCFRQRDLAAASRWASRHGVPLVFDPLISAYDKQVDERGKLAAGSPSAIRLLKSERDLFARADMVLADTPEHAAYFAEVLGVKGEKLAVVFVGAEAGLFHPAPLKEKQEGAPLEVLFYGSFIPLQGPEVVVEAAKRYTGRPVHWTLLGQGPLRQACEEKAKDLKNVSFEDWLPYEKLPARIHEADVLLGVFGTTQKASRVIPNKVYQALACGRAVVTRQANAYPELLKTREISGLLWIPAGDAESLARHIEDLAGDRDKLRRMGKAAAETSAEYFSEDSIRQQLAGALETLMGNMAPDQHAR